MVSFLSEEHWSQFADPRDDFKPTRVRTEIRVHPLTGQITRIAHLGLPVEREYRTPEHLAKDPLPIFAPPLVTQVTPTFLPDDLPEPRYQRGGSTLFPNLMPYDRYSPVAAIGDQPFVEPQDISAEDVADALVLMRSFFADLDPAAALGVVGWNFWPGAGSSIPHPHLQGVASGRAPERQARELEGERRYLEGNGEPFWQAFLDAERAGPRWIGRDHGWSAVTEFAPRSVVPETVLVSDTATDLQDASDETLLGLATWLTRLAGAHTRLGLPQFNVILHPTAPVEPQSTLRARYIPRLYVVEPTHSSDVFWVQMGLDEAVTAVIPEEWTVRLRSQLE